MHTGLITITTLYHVVIATHGFTRTIDILICIIAITVEQRCRQRSDGE